VRGRLFPDHALEVAAWMSVGNADAHMFENASEVDTSKIAELNRYQASQ
jgi:hypothetical protein